MKKQFLFSLLIYQTALLIAQQPTTRYSDGRINMLTSQDRFQYINPFDDRQVTTRGTRYFFDSLYRPGELKTNQGLYTTELLYRYDQIERTVQVKTESGKELLLREKDVIYFKLFIGEQVVFFIPATVPNGRKLTLMQVIYKSPTMQLLRDPKKYIFRVKSEHIDGYSTDLVYDDIRKDYRYFVNKGENTPYIEVKPEAKYFGRAFPSKKALILKLFKEGQKKEGLTVSKLAAIMKELDKPETNDPN